MPISSKDITYRKKRVLIGHEFESDVVNVFIRNKLVGQIERFKNEPSEYWVSFTPKQQDINCVDEYLYDGYNEAIKDIISTAIEEGDFVDDNTKLTEDRKPEFFIHSYLTADSDKVYDIRYGFKNSTWTRVGFVRHENWSATEENNELPYFALRKFNLGIDPPETENRRFDSLGEAIKWVLQYSFEWRQGVEFGESLQESNGTFFSRTTPYLFYSDTQGYIISVFYKDSTGTIEIGRIMYGYNRDGSYNAQRTWFGSNVKGEQDFDTRKEALDWISEVIPSYKRHTFESKTVIESKGDWQKIKDKISVSSYDITKHIKIKKISDYSYNAYYVYYKGLRAFEIYEYNNDPYDDRYIVVGYVFGEQDWFVNEVIRKNYWNFRHVGTGKKYGIEYGLPDISESEPFDSRNEAIQAVTKAIVDNYKAFDKLAKRKPAWTNKIYPVDENVERKSPNTIHDSLVTESRIGEKFRQTIKNRFRQNDNSKTKRPKYSTQVSTLAGHTRIYLLRNGYRIGSFSKRQDGVYCNWNPDIDSKGSLDSISLARLIASLDRYQTFLTVKEGIQWIIQQDERFRKMHKVDENINEEHDDKNSKTERPKYSATKGHALGKESIYILRNGKTIGAYRRTKGGIECAWWIDLPYYTGTNPGDTIVLSNIQEGIQWIIKNHEDNRKIYKLDQQLDETTENNITYSTVVDDYCYNMDPKDPIYKRQIRVLRGTTVVGYINYPFMLSKNKTITTIPSIDLNPDPTVPGSYGQYTAWASDGEKIYQGPMYFPELKNAIKWIIEEDTHALRKKLRKSKKVQNLKVNEAKKNKKYSTKVYREVPLPSGEGYIKKILIFFGRESIGEIFWCLTKDKTLDMTINPPFEADFYIRPFGNKTVQHVVIEKFNDITSASKWIIERHKKLSTSKDKKPTQTNSVMKETENKESSSIYIKTKISPYGNWKGKPQYEQTIKIFKGNRQLGVVVCILNHDKTLHIDIYGEYKSYIAGIKNRDGDFQATTYFQNLRDAIDWVIDNDITKSMTEQKTDNENNNYIRLDGPHYSRHAFTGETFKYYKLIKNAGEIGRVGWWMSKTGTRTSDIFSIFGRAISNPFDSISKAIQDVIDNNKNTESK